ncbi:class I SAM-dependent methyltransferase [Nocardiopsis ganjiahuensis]|uniref:class I SAM-dependent methyltransferase n=1 Tax=Nocardiopsis ganjiahuensis TaxID=239984 RepID=UPI000348262E|nr:class I SAM-dependent methyltransferase [Nocardiopsis ganjiahuensis]
MYDTDYAAIYDAVMIHRGKDYAGEAARIRELVDERAPGATSLLDVACGTGLHLRALAEHFDEVAGLDGSEEMLALARARVPGLRAWRSDLRRIRLAERFDVVCCLFAIPHLDSEAELADVVRLLLDHLNPGGVLLVEPWVGPDEFLPGYVSRDVVDQGDRTVVRLSHSRLLPGRGDRMELAVHYAVADPEEGLRHATESMRMSLFTPEQFATAFAEAGCEAEHVRTDPFAHGLWIGRRAHG